MQFPDDSVLTGLKKWICYNYNPKLAHLGEVLTGLKKWICYNTFKGLCN
ncbi:transposase [Endomicrobium proavitum]|uniref:Transposase n=1 Tax=Endomicrobium proavitum TaxID=1408281 RepID=A0A0G3WLW9_9BACT|nr:transposase [Endomicrobium proavitum]